MTRIAAASFDRLLYLGDVYERGSASDFRVNYATTYGRLAAAPRRRRATTTGRATQRL